jgi:hypothetical protein
MIALLLAAAAVDAAPPQAAADALAAQSRAWNAGDLEGALAAYCPRPEITWVNRSGISRGFAPFAASMRSDFSDPARMGEMTIEILDSRTVSPDSALVSLRWQIARDGRRLMGGVSTQLWAPCDGRLRIVLEHAT